MQAISHTPGTAEYLSFSLGKEEYAMSIQQIQEIRSYEAPTRIANAPEHIKGVINLRGAIVPVLDLRLKLNTGEATYDSTTAVIVANAGERTTGFVVDSVSDVLSIPDDKRQPLPDIRTDNSGYITGLGLVDGRTLALVDATKLFA